MRRRCVMPPACTTVARDVVDQLLLDELLAIPDRIEDLAYGQRRGGVLADDAETVLVLRRHGIFHPERTVGLQILAQTTCLDGCEAMVHVVQQVHIPPQRFTRGSEQRRHRTQVFFGGPEILGGQVCIRRFVKVAILRHTIGRGKARHTGLQTDGAIAQPLVVQSILDGGFQRGAIGMSIDHRAFTAGAAQQLVQGEVGKLALDVP